MAAWLLLSCVAMCVERFGFATWYCKTQYNGCFDVFCLFLHIAVTWYFGIFACKTHCNGCMNVAWGLIWGESQSTKPCVFPCEVLAAGDERYLVSAAGAGWVRPRLGVVCTVMAASMCCAYSCTLQLHGVLESLLAWCHGCVRNIIVLWSWTW